MTVFRFAAAATLLLSQPEHVLADMKAPSRSLRGAREAMPGAATDAATEQPVAGGRGLDLSAEDAEKYFTISVGWAGAPAEEKAACLDVAERPYFVQIYTCNNAYPNQKFLLDREAKDEDLPQIRWQMDPHMCLTGEEDHSSGAGPAEAVETSGHEHHLRLTLQSCLDKEDAGRKRQAFKLDFDMEADPANAGRIIWLGGGQEYCLENLTGRVNKPLEDLPELIEVAPRRCAADSTEQVGKKQLWYAIPSP
eukprot:TRINITY_DN1303_c0_g1_i1.p1 TRINITY_DN1303_c0_g1~~TRINITY_DN1303_c0_g1_i1.p1  ORF type:complete len:251 (-),score=57.75 TRINITY_DN1303_c0_g1_i1:941-1693(-)